MKNKKLLLAPVLLILAAVASLPLLVAAAPSFPPPTGLTDAQFNTISVGTGSGGNAKMVIDSSGRMTNDPHSFPLLLKDNNGFQFMSDAGANIRFQGNYIDSPLTGNISIQKIETAGGIYNGTSPGVHPVKIVDNDGITIGTDSGANYLRIWHDATNAYMQAQTGAVQILDTDGLYIKDNAGNISTRISTGGTGNINTTGSISSAGISATGDIYSSGAISNAALTIAANGDITNNIPSSVKIVNVDGLDVQKIHNSKSLATTQAVCDSWGGVYALGYCNYPLSIGDRLNVASLTNSSVNTPVKIDDADGLSTPSIGNYIANSDPNNALRLRDDQGVEVTNYAGTVGLRLLPDGTIEAPSGIVEMKLTDSGITHSGNFLNSITTNSWLYAAGASITGGFTPRGAIYNPGTDNSGRVYVSDNFQVTNSTYLDGYTYIGGNLNMAGGIYSTAGTLTLDDNVYVNGYVGIGTSSPSSALHIKGTGLPSSFIYLDSNAVSQDSGIRIMEAGNVRHHIYNQSSNDSLMILANSAGPGGIELTQSGNVGIGVASPTYKLDVNGTVRAVGTLTTNSSLFADGSLYVDDDFYLDDNIRLYMDSTNVSDYWDIENNSNGDLVFNPENNRADGLSTYRVWFNDTDGTAWKTGGGSWSNSSDIRLKDIKGPYKKGLLEINKLAPVIFRYKTDNVKHLPSDKDFVGLIAQEVQGVFPEAVSIDDQGYLGLDLHSIQIALINAIKELKSEKDAEVSELKAELAELRAVVCELKPTAVQCEQ